MNSYLTKLLQIIHEFSSRYVLAAQKKKEEEEEEDAFLEDGE